MMLLPPEFKRLLSALSANRVEYLVVGGYAVIFHGYIRTTGDMNVWVALTSENASRGSQPRVVRRRTTLAHQVAYPGEGYMTSAAEYGHEIAFLAPGKILCFWA